MPRPVNSGEFANCIFRYMSHCKMWHLLHEFSKGYTKVTSDRILLHAECQWLLPQNITNQTQSITSKLQTTVFLQETDTFDSIPQTRRCLICILITSSKGHQMQEMIMESKSPERQKIPASLSDVLQPVHLLYCDRE